MSDTPTPLLVPGEMPPPASIVADLPTLRAYVGARTMQDDALLEGRLFVATEWVYERVMLTHRLHNEVQEAILLLASRLYKRRQSPEGVTGFGGEGGLVRAVSNDPDISDMIERHLDMKNAGIA